MLKDGVCFISGRQQPVNGDARKRRRPACVGGGMVRVHGGESHGGVEPGGAVPPGDAVRAGWHGTSNAGPR